jgi:hypothetical protein
MHEGQNTPDGQPPAGWQFKPEETPRSQAPASSLPTPSAPQNGMVSWTASEFIAHQKSAGWYGRLGLAAAVACILVYLFTKDAISAGMLIVVAAVLAVFAARQPRVLSYKVDAGGIAIDQKFYPYMNFRSFAVIDEGAVSSIVFMPLKRFMPALTIYYDPKDEESILGLLSNNLPFEQKTHDVVDSFMKRIRF